MKDLSASDGNNECGTVEIENKNSKNLIITCCYRPPSDAIKGILSFLENVFKKANTEKKTLFYCWRFQSKLFRLQQKFRNSNILQSNFCRCLHSFDNKTN